MIRQLCPHCAKLVELPDAAAGTTAPCPACGQSFAVAARYTPSVDPTAGPPAPKETPAVPDPSPAPPDRPLPPPGLAPDALNPAPPAAGPRPAAEREVGVSLSPAMVGWLPVGCLTLALALTFFAWVGTYPGGVRVYSQHPWQALVGKFTVNPLPDDLLTDEPDLEKNTPTSWWLWLYFPALLAAVVIGWVDRAFDNPDATTLPGPLVWVVGVWPHRLTLIGGLAALALLLLLIQSWRGFGLEVAVQRVVAARFADAEAAADTTPKRNKVAVQKGQEVNRFGLQGTTAFDLAIAAHLFAVLGAGGRYWLDRRGAKPPPRLVVEY
ncbi:MAG: hypothetical protein U0871_25650 [Gemmataceae bacterium]